MSIYNVMSVFKLLYMYISDKYKMWSVDPRVYRQNNYIKIQAYDDGEIYDFYIPYCRKQRYKHKQNMHDIVLVSHRGENTNIKLYPGCKLDFKATEMDGMHFVVKNRHGETEEKEYIH